MPTPDYIPPDWSTFFRALAWRVATEPFVWLNLVLAITSVLLRIAFGVRSGPMDDAIDYALGIATIGVIAVTLGVYAYRSWRDR